MDKVWTGNPLFDAAAVAGVAFLVVVVGGLGLWHVVDTLRYHRQEQADQPPTPVPVPPRTGSPFAPKKKRFRVFDDGDSDLSHVEKAVIRGGTFEQDGAR